MTSKEKTPATFKEPPVWQPPKAAPTKQEPQPEAKLPKAHAEFAMLKSEVQVTRAEVAAIRSDLAGIRATLDALVAQARALRQEDGHGQPRAVPPTLVVEREEDNREETDGHGQPPAVDPRVLFSVPARRKGTPVPILLGAAGGTQP
jgi:hypothetical protein